MKISTLDYRYWSCSCNQKIANIIDNLKLITESTIIRVDLEMDRFEIIRQNTRREPPIADAHDVRGVGRAG